MAGYNDVVGGMLEDIADYLAYTPRSLSHQLARVLNAAKRGAMKSLAQHLHTLEKTLPLELKKGRKYAVLSTLLSVENVLNNMGKTHRRKLLQTHLKELLGSIAHIIEIMEMHVGNVGTRAAFATNLFKLYTIQMTKGQNIRQVQKALHGVVLGLHGVFRGITRHSSSGGMRSDREVLQTVFKYFHMVNLNVKTGDMKAVDCLLQQIHYLLHGLVTLTATRVPQNLFDSITVNINMMRQSASMNTLTSVDVTNFFGQASNILDLTFNLNGVRESKEFVGHFGGKADDLVKQVSVVLKKIHTSLAHKDLKTIQQLFVQLVKFMGGLQSQVKDMTKLSALADVMIEFEKMQQQIIANKISFELLQSFIKTKMQQLKTLINVNITFESPKTQLQHIFRLIQNLQTAIFTANDKDRHTVAMELLTKLGEFETQDKTAQAQIKQVITNLHDAQKLLAQGKLTVSEIIHSLIKTMTSLQKVDKIINGGGSTTTITTTTTTEMTHTAQDDITNIQSFFSQLQTIIKGGSVKGMLCFGSFLYLALFDRSVEVSSITYFEFTRIVCQCRLTLVFSSTRNSYVI